MFLGKYFPPSMVTKLKNEITNFRQRPDKSLFEAWECYKLSIDRCPNHNMLPIIQIDTFYNGLTLRHRDTINAAADRTFMKRRPEECYDLIKNLTAHHNDWTLQPNGINQQVKADAHNCETCGGPHSYNDYPATAGQTQNVYAARAYQGGNSYNLKMNTASSSGSGTLPSNTITNPMEDLKGITTRSRNAYQGPTIATTSSSPPKVVERKTEVTKDTMPPTNNESTKDVQPLVVQIETPIPNSEPVIALVAEPVVALVSAPKPNPKPSIPYPSRLHDQKLRDKTNNQKEKIFQIFKDLDFIISFADSLILMPKFGQTIKTTVGQTRNVYVAGAYNQGGNSYQPQGNRNLLSYRSDNYLRPPGFNQNQNRNNPNQNYKNQNKNQGNNHGIPQVNNQGRNQFFQGASHGQNPPLAYQAPAYQAPGYQAPVHQASIPQPQVVTTTKFAILKNMQTNMTSLTNSNLELTNMFGQFMKMTTASSSDSGLPSNTITNPKEDLKGITTRSGNAYKGPTIPTTSSLPKVVERETMVIRDTPIVAPVAEPVVAPVSAPKPNQKLLIPYPSRLHDQKLCDKANDQNEKFFKIFKDLDFKISFTDALILMPKFGPTIKNQTFNLDQTSRYSANYNDMTANRIDVIDMASEEYSQEVLGFSDVIASGNPTPYYDPIISTSSLTLTPFGDSDFLLEKVGAFLALEDDLTSPEVNHSYYDTEGDILLLKAFLNDDPSLPPPTQGMYLPQIRKELKICEAKNDKSLIDEPHEVELNDLPPHLEYAFLEGDDKLPVIIAKDLSVEEKAALIKVLKSHKQAIAWKLFDIKGWRVCIDYHKLNEATRKDHFPLPFMVQMRERLAGNEYYCFLDGFSDYFEFPIDLKDQETTTFTCPYGTFTYRRMPFGLCNAPGTFQSIVYTDHSALKYLFAKKDSKAGLLRWILLLQEFKFKVIDTKGAENLAADHLSRLENPHQNVLDPKEINEVFPLETLNMGFFHGSEDLVIKGQNLDYDSLKSENSWTFKTIKHKKWKRRAATQQHLFITTTRKSMGYLPRSACLGSLSLTQSSNSLVLRESLEIKDNHL
nr:reverse transcriptase domain-containing protein [Tanacetum cinerariifolium]